MKDLSDEGEMALAEAIVRLAASDYKSAYRRWVASGKMDGKSRRVMRECEQCLAFWLGERGEEAAAYLRRLVDEGR